MKNCRRAAVLLLAFTMIIFAGCSNKVGMVKNLFNSEDSSSQVVESTDDSQDEDHLRDTVLYYKDDKGFLVPVMRKLPWTDGKGIAKIALKAMIDTPANREYIKEIGLTPVIPANTDIRGMTVFDGVCRVDFTEDFLNYNTKEEETALIKAVVYTLTEFMTIDKVQLMVEGKTIENLKHGTNIAQCMNRAGINYAGESADGNEAIVYFEGTANGLETYFVPVAVSLGKDNGESPNILDALDALVKGPPSGSGLFTSIPQGTQVVSVDVHSGIANINLTEEILDIVENKNVVNGIAKAFGLTVKEQYPDVLGVKILVNGQEFDKEGTKNEPIVVPTFANQY